MSENTKTTLLETMTLTEDDLAMIAGGDAFEGTLDAEDKYYLDLTIHDCKHKFFIPMEKYLNFAQSQGYTEEAITYLRKNWCRVR